MRTNWRSENEVLVGILNRCTGSPKQGWVTNDKGERVSNPGHYYIEYTYGKSRLERMVSDDGSAKNITPRWSARELNRWLIGHLSAIVRKS